METRTHLQRQQLPLERLFKRSAHHSVLDSRPMMIIIVVVVDVPADLTIASRDQRRPRGPVDRGEFGRPANHRAHGVGRAAAKERELRGRVVARELTDALKHAAQQVFARCGDRDRGGCVRAVGRGRGRRASTGLLGDRSERVQRRLVEQRAVVRGVDRQAVEQQTERLGETALGQRLRGGGGRGRRGERAHGGHPRGRVGRVQ